MASWLNHVAIATPRNATTTHTIDSSNATGGGTVVNGTAFTPTAGRLLVIVASGAVTCTTPTGCTLPSSGSAVNNSGLYVWYKASASGSDTFTTTHNGTNYPVLFDIYEFPAGSTFVKAASSISNANGATLALTGLTGTNSVFGVSGVDNITTTTAVTSTWTTGPTQQLTTAVGASGTDGYIYSLAYQDGVTAASATWGNTMSPAQTGYERLMFAVLVGTGYTAPTLFASATAQGATTSSTISVTMPASLAANDYAVLFVPAVDTTDTYTSNNQSFTELVPSSGTSFTTNLGLYVFQKRLAGTESGATLTITFSTIKVRNAVLLVFRGLSGTALADVSAAQTTTTSATQVAPSVTIPNANELLITAYGLQQAAAGTTTWSTPTGLTVGPTLSPTIANSQAAAIFYKLSTASGATGTFTSTASRTSTGMAVTLGVPSSSSTNITIAGTVSTQTTVAPAGSVTAIQNTVIAGAVSTLATAGFAGSVSAITGTTKVVTFDTGNVGDVIVSTDSSNYLSVTGSPTYGTPIHGSASVNCTSATVAQYVTIVNTGYTGSHWGSIFTTVDTVNASSAVRILEWCNSSNTPLAAVRLNSTGVIDIGTSGGSQAGATTGTYNVAGKTIRIDYYFDATNVGASVAVTLQIFYDGNANGTTPDETLGPITVTSASSFTRWLVGSAATAVAHATRYDTFRVSTIGPLGPYIASNTVAGPVSILATGAPSGAVAASTPANANMATGVSMSGTTLAYESQTQLDADMAAISATGVGWVRFDFAAVQIEASAGVRDYSNIDRMVASATSHGLKVHGILTTLPSWAAANYQIGPSGSTQVNAFTSFAAATVARYPQVLSWEVWNEPNNAAFWTGANHTDYSALLKATYPVIKANNSLAQVLAGGTAGGQSSPNDSATWYTNLYADGDKAYFDVANVHPYPNAVTSILTNSNYASATLPSGVKSYYNGAISRDTTVYRSQIASLKVVTTGSTPDGFMHMMDTGSITSGQYAGGSFWVKGPAGVTFSAGNRIHSTADAYLTDYTTSGTFTGNWQLVMVAPMVYSGAAYWAGVELYTSTACTFWVDDSVVVNQGSNSNSGEMYNVPSIISVMATNGDSTKKIWATECGFPTGGSSPNVPEWEQSGLLIELIQTWKTNAGTQAGNFFAYTLRDTSASTSGSTDREDYFGLYHYDGSDKGAGAAFTTYNSAYFAGSKTIAGTLSALTISAPTGSITATKNVSLAGPVSTLSTAALAGAVSTTKTAALAGTLSTLTTSPLAGSVTTTSSATIAGTLSTQSIASVSGSVTTTTSTIVVGTSSAQTTAALAGTVTTTSTVTIAGTVSTLNTVALAGAVATGVSATVVGTLSTQTIAALSGTVTTIKAVTVAGVISALTLTAPVGSITGAQNVTISGVLSGLSTTAYAGAVLTTSTVALVGTVSTLNTIANIGTVTVTTNTNISGFASASIIGSLAGTVSTTSSAAIAAPPSTVVVSAPTGTVLASQNVAIAGSVSSTALTALSGAVSGNANIAATTPVTLAIISFAGSVTAYKNVALVGPVSPLAIGSFAGSVGSNSNVLLAGPLSATTIAAPAGTVVSAQNVVISGALSTETFSAAAGTVGSTSTANVVGTVSSIAINAIAGSVAAIKNATIAGTVSSLATTAYAGAITVTSTVNVSAAPATLLIGTYSGAISTTSNVNLTAATAADVVGSYAGTATVTSTATIVGSVTTLNTVAFAGAVNTTSTAIIAGPSSALTIVAPAGTLVLGQATTVAGTLSGTTTTAFAGSVTALRNIVIAGTVSAISVNSPAGSITVGGSINNTASAAIITISSVAGSITAIRNIVVAGTASSLTLTAPVGAMVGTAVITGTVSTVTISAYVGAVSTTVNAIGATATLVSGALPGTIVGNAAVAGALSTLSIVAPAGTLAGAVNVLGLVGAIQLTAAVGSILTSSTTNVAGSASSLTFNALAGTVATTLAVTVTGTTSSLVLSSYAGNIGTNSVVSIAGLPSTFGMSALSGSVVTTSNVSITAPTAHAAVSSLAGGVVAFSNVVVSAAAANFTVSAPAGNVLGSTTSSIPGVVATTAFVTTPGIITTTSTSNVSAPPALLNSVALAGTVSSAVVIVGSSSTYTITAVTGTVDVSTTATITGPYSFIHTQALAGTVSGTSVIAGSTGVVHVSARPGEVTITAPYRDITLKYVVGDDRWVTTTGVDRWSIRTSGDRWITSTQEIE